MADLIQQSDSLNQGRLKLNEAIKEADKAKGEAGQAVSTSNQAKQIAEQANQKSDYTQTQLDQVTGASTIDPAVEQMKVGSDGATIYNSPDERVRKEHEAVTRQLADTTTDLNSRGANVLLNGVKGDNVADDTQALRDIIANNSYIIIPIPPVKYRITDEIVVPSNRTIEFVGGNHWNPNGQREVSFVYDGVEDKTKAMFRVSKSPTGVEPTADTTNVKFRGGCLLDGNNKAGYGFYSAFATNESDFQKITAINTLTDGIRIEKSWYASFRDLTAKSNQGNGITIGKNNWGGVNGCHIENIRGWGNGKRGDFTEQVPDASYGVGLFLGSGCRAENVVSEYNYGAGLVFSLGTGSSLKVDTVYLEKNGIDAKNAGKTARAWGLIVLGSLAGSNKTIDNIFLAGTGSADAQCIWLTGLPSNIKTAHSVELKNIGGGGIIKADWDNYALSGMLGTIVTTIEGHLPKRVEGILNSNWTTLYVRSTGNDNNDGRTAATAFATLGKAIEKAKSISTIITIDCTGITVDKADIDLSGINREITINGGTTALIEGTSNNNNGLFISNAMNTVNINNFNNISRLTVTNCRKIRSSNTSYRDKDGAFGGTMEIRNSEVFLIGCTLNGSLSTNSTKNGPRLYNSTLTLKDTTISSYTLKSYFSISEGSVLKGDIYIPTFEEINWVDGTGYAIGGERIRSARGTLTFV